MMALAMFASQAFAQTISLPSTAYRPGRYLPLRIEAATARLIAVRGDGIQGIDWTAPGRSSVVVPLLVYESTDRLKLTVNGSPVTLDMQPLGEADVPPGALSDFWTTIDPKPIASGFDLAAYEAADLWQPERSASTRQWTLIALAVTVLVLGVAVHAHPKRRTLWLMVAGVGLCVGISRMYPVDEPRRSLPADGQPGWEWTWAAAVKPRIDVEPWTPGLRFVPRSPEQLKTADAAVYCDTAGAPEMIRAAISRGERAVFIRSRQP
ncbi:MAG: hypothetical protein JWM57_3576 [Phycisphaerales bacterium]|nr:hypothetical protein [Phycisphaerales bacterium]